MSYGQPYWNFPQNTPGPPQPQWRPSEQPRPGWRDPRPTDAIQRPASVATSYNPNVYGPISPATSSQISTSHPPSNPLQAPYYQAPNNPAWTSNYNQQAFNTDQDIALRPALPPRPVSALNTPYDGWSSAADGQVGYTSPLPPPPRPPKYMLGQEQINSNTQSQNHAYGQHTSQYEVNPPDRRPGSLSSTHPVGDNASNYGWQGPSIHAGAAPVAQQQIQPLQQSQQPAFLPPPPMYASQPASSLPHDVRLPTPSASALGVGGPSDWEHFSAGEYNDGHTDTQTSAGVPFIQGLSSTPEQVYKLPANQNNAASDPSLSQSPVLPPRVSSADAVPQAPSRRHNGSADPFSRTGTIDNAIAAWSSPSDPALSAVRPLRKTSKPRMKTPNVLSTQTQTETVESPKPVMVTNATQTDFPPAIKTVTKIETKTLIKEVDPYEDLKDEYRSSLSRYVTMLRAERDATDETAKSTILSNFVNKEIKLRSILLNTELAELVPSGELVELRKLASQAQENRAMIERLRSNTLSSKLPTLDTSSAATAESHDDSFVMVSKGGEALEVPEFSPGGRPRMVVPPTIARNRTPDTRSQTPKQGSTVNQPVSPDSNAPMTLDDYVMPETSLSARIGAVTPASRAKSGSTEQLISPVVDNHPPPLNFHPARTAYTPFRYNEKLDQARNTISEINPADAAYTKLRQNQINDSGRLLGQELAQLAVSVDVDRAQSITPSRAKQQHEEAFVGLLRQQSKALRKKAMSPAPTVSSLSPRTATPTKSAAFIPPLLAATRTLKQVIPPSLPNAGSTKAQHPRLVPINSAATNTIDDFSFIKATVQAWDRENRQNRNRLDNERKQRESDYQTRLDELFESNEIGYADIRGHEEDFRLAEAQSKYAEDQDELVSFETHVYHNVTSRLRREIAELDGLRTQVVDILESSGESASASLKTAVAGRVNESSVPMIQMLPLMLLIFNKLEIRHRKLAEASFEYERRRKVLEETILTTNGDKEGRKNLDTRYAKAQAMQVLSEARARDERANRLMDSFDRSVVKGLAENQEWVDEVLIKAQSLRDLVLGDSANQPDEQNSKNDLLYGPGGVKDTIDLLADAVAVVEQDSKDLVKASGQADFILNESDFAMFLAEANIANAKPQDFEKLKAEKQKEDQKLKNDADNRMRGIQRAPTELLALIRTIKDNIGVDNNHRARIDQALEAAKKRNDASATRT